MKKYLLSKKYKLIRKVADLYDVGAEADCPLFVTVAKRILRAQEAQN